MSLLTATRDCERVRAQISLELDGELSQIERRMVASHLGRCAECRTFADGTTSFTHALREAPHEQLARPVEIRRVRRSSLAGRVQVSVAAAVALMAVGLASQFGSSSVADAGSLGAVGQFQTLAELERELALIQLSQAHGPSSADPVL